MQSNVCHASSVGLVSFSKLTPVYPRPPAGNKTRQGETCHIPYPASKKQWNAQQVSMLQWATLSRRSLRDTTRSMTPLRSLLPMSPIVWFLLFCVVRQSVRLIGFISSHRERRRAWRTWELAACWLITCNVLYLWKLLGMWLCLALWMPPMQW